jgi:tetratricopeptide (TPR) repeat protein
MRPYRRLALLGVVSLAAPLLLLGGCARKEAPSAGEAKVAPASAANDGKIPVTTTSEEARAAFLEGRDMVDKLKLTESVAHFSRAVSLDPHFAWAELFLANTAPTGREFFEHLDKAVALADKASEGERLLIQAAKAGANAETAKQKELLDRLVAAYPNDERAHFALAGWHFGQQDYAPAIEHYRKANALAPTFSSAYNLLGYAYRQAGDYANAEKAFQKYIELIPNDPNPYDSYAELLLKMGRYDDSIAQYRKALAIDPNFLASHTGIFADLMYQGKAKEASAELDEALKKSRTAGERRTALFGKVVLAVDSGKLAEALAATNALYDVAQSGNDVPAMAGDLQLKGNILLEMGKGREAKAAFEESLAKIEGSNLAAEVKENAKLQSHYNLARAALVANDRAEAEAEAAAHRTAAQAKNTLATTRQAHELAGILALARKDYDTAIAELPQANPQNPYNLYRLCEAHRGKGDAAKAKELCRNAADFNSLPQLNSAIVRSKARAGAA